MSLKNTLKMQAKIVTICKPFEKVGGRLIEKLINASTDRAVEELIKNGYDPWNVLWDKHGNIYEIF